MLYPCSYDAKLSQAHGTNRVRGSTRQTRRHHVSRELGAGLHMVTGYNRALIGGFQNRPTLVMYQESPRPSGTAVTACAETHHIATGGNMWYVLVACVTLIIPPFACPKRLGNIMH